VLHFLNLTLTRVLIFFTLSNSEIESCLLHIPNKEVAIKRAMEYCSFGEAEKYFNSVIDGENELGGIDLEVTYKFEIHHQMKSYVFNHFTSC
jgi:hypothetical protein